MKLMVDRIVILSVPVVMYDQSEIVPQKCLKSLMTEEGKEENSLHAYYPKYMEINSNLLIYDAFLYSVLK